MRFWASSAEVNNSNIVRTVRKEHTQSKNNNNKERKQGIKDVKVYFFFQKRLKLRNRRSILNVAVQKRKDADNEHKIVLG